MSAATSPGTGLAYGLRLCAACRHGPLDSFYAMTSGQHAEQPPQTRSGTESPRSSDQALLVAIEADLEASHHGRAKPAAQLGSASCCRDIRVARKRPPDAREQSALAPSLPRPSIGNNHDGEIITHDPNLMWGTDGVRTRCSRSTTEPGLTSPPSALAGSAGMDEAATASQIPCTENLHGPCRAVEERRLARRRFAMSFGVTSQYRRPHLGKGDKLDHARLRA